MQHPFKEFQEFVAENQPLAPLTWFRLGGPAAYFARPRNIEDMRAVLSRANEAGIPYKLLGGGTNVLVRDPGVEALVVLMESPHFSDVSVVENRIKTGAAVPLTALISQTARAGLAGLEILTGIPGTVGGALRGNAGSRQGAIGPFVSRVTVLDSAFEVQERERDDLNFVDRESNLDEPVILSAEFELSQEEPESVVRRMRRIWIVKKENQPYGHQSSGCIFKNPSADISAGALIDQAGMKGTRHGGAEVSDRHANFIIAHPGAKADDVLHLIDQIQQRVWQQFGYELELQLRIW
ncbi:UDP-N-acetylmuramate dehydrogenase [Planctomyces sp. SH-PL62]|uniref:UDP-N-acetylmuramate dehydrogenase n=1 Tax=Planctomyces sp. SH-PL62 TaxID=1636152 RepID=UPI00078E3132|nr:UDP-N-acetylmuramate dehydrogenase [Planctomyces sp. SH-PL62]AMV39389.1 UDP-N-acetylenolpyruvoylglucosamine reductase [Planctomyces sp. SH-PL62]